MDGSVKKEAVVLLNMGGPNNMREVELFLKNMFDDPNILTMKSALLRKFVARMIIFSRVEAAQAVYEELGGKSPIVGHTKNLVAKLQEKLGENTIVDFAMRYTPPFADEVCERLEAEDVRNIYLIPLYPQYSTTTTKSSLEDFHRAYEKVGGNARIHEVRNFYRNDLYNKTLIDLIAKALDGNASEEFELVFSAHGLPQKIINKGDPYQKQIENHVEILSSMLEDEGLNFAKIHLAYQSKVGPMKWLEPSLEAKLEEIETKKIIIFPIAFTIDNSETDFELGEEYKEVADKLGFEEYRVSKCPNDEDGFVAALQAIYAEVKG